MFDGIYATIESEVAKGADAVSRIPAEVEPVRAAAQAKGSEFIERISQAAGQVQQTGDAMVSGFQTYSGKVQERDSKILAALGNLITGMNDTLARIDNIENQVQGILARSAQ